MWTEFNSIHEKVFKKHHNNSNKTILGDSLMCFFSEFTIGNMLWVT